MLNEPVGENSVQTKSPLGLNFFAERHNVVNLAELVDLDRADGPTRWRRIRGLINNLNRQPQLNRPVKIGKRGRQGRGFRPPL